MPTEKVKGGWKNKNTKNKPFKTKKEAQKQLAAIKISQANRGKSGHHDMGKIMSGS